MKRLNRLTDVTYQDEIYDKLCERFVLGYIFEESAAVDGAYVKNNQSLDLEHRRKIQGIMAMYEFEARFMPDDTLTILCKQSPENTAEFTKFVVADSDGVHFTTIQGTECPMCSIFVNDDIITIRNLCGFLHTGDLSIMVDEIALAIGSYLEYDIIDKGTDIVTLIPQKKSATDE